MICKEMSDKELIAFFEDARRRFLDAAPFSAEEQKAECDYDRVRFEMAERFVKRFGG